MLYMNILWTFYVRFTYSCMGMLHYNHMQDTIPRIQSACSKSGQHGWPVVKSLQIHPIKNLLGVKLPMRSGYFSAIRHRHWPPYQCTQNWIYVLLSNTWHFHTRRNLSETTQEAASHKPKKAIDTRLTKARTAIDRLSIIWKSDLIDKVKRSFFQAAIMSILLYGCSNWTLTKTAGEEARRQLHKNVASNIEQVLAATPHKAPTIRTRHAGHSWRNKDELISDVLLWTLAYGQAKAGRTVRTFIQQLCEDTGCSPEDLTEAMNDREKWRGWVRDIRASGTTWWWCWWWYNGYCIYSYIDYCLKIWN